MSTDKCANCPDRNSPDEYICDNECPFNEDGTVKENHGHVYSEDGFCVYCNEHFNDIRRRMLEEEYYRKEYYRKQEENSRTPQ